MTTNTCMKSLFLFCINILFILQLGCGDTPVQPDLTETEKKLTANTWHGVLWVKSTKLPIQITILGEELNFKSDKTLSLKKCDVTTDQPWRVVDSTIGTFVWISNTFYYLDKLTADSLVLQDISEGKSYLFMKNFKGYNRVKMHRIYENGLEGITIGLDCANIEKPEIPEYNFSGGYVAPSPTVDKAHITFNQGVNTATVKITVDDGDSTVAVLYDDLCHSGSYTLSFDADKWVQGTYRVSYSVKPSDAASIKTTYSYFYVMKATW